MDRSTRRRPVSWRSLLLIVAIVWGASQAWSWWRDGHAARTAQRHAQPGDILMFTTNDCPYCAKARAWLKQHGVPWSECNIERDQACQAVFNTRGAPGVPLLRVRGQWRLGFDANWVADTLAATQPPT